MTNDEKEVENRFNCIIDKSESLTDDELKELRALMTHATGFMLQPRTVHRAQFRMAIDLIESIRRFDAASGDLVATTNRLTKRILAFSIIAVVLALISIIFGACPHLTYWLCGGPIN